MARLLFLAHRLPYPPNKGDKVRSYHLLRHLAARHEVHLGTFIDDPDDEPHLPAVRALCASVHVSRIRPVWARSRSVWGLARGEALTLAYYRDGSLGRWVDELMRRDRIDATIVFSSAMAPYAASLRLPMLVDFVDVDSAKWAQYGSERPWPLSWLYQREGRRLLEYESLVARRAAACFFVTSKEVELFESLAPDCAGLACAIGNGVDAEYFAPGDALVSPFSDSEIPIVFTGAMDYWPNVDAVTWFADAMLPALRARWPATRFHVVGRSPSTAVQALRSAGVNVTGTVPDVRPYLQHAAVVVAPLRLARGVQNKILEAMAMARPVVAASACVEAIDATPGSELLPARDRDDYLAALFALIADPQRARAIGQAARARVVGDYSWPARLRPLDRRIDDVLAARASAAS
ncbi:MAG: TIGR03087 family PEP-CTERM/XrtA system glycosyltransferase [Burkholderiaceae bacterium]